MDRPPPRYALLRDNMAWEGVMLVGLDVEPDGALALAHLPGPPPSAPVALPGPYDAAPAGLALGDCGDYYRSDPQGRQLVAYDGMCAAERRLPGDAPAGPAGLFARPRGLLLLADTLFVADSGRVLLFRVPELELVGVWQRGLRMPRALAADGAGRIYLLDDGLRALLRFDRLGGLDAAYRSALAPGLAGANPVALLILPDDTLVVADASSERLLHFDPEGRPLDPLPAGGAAAPDRPRALAAHAGRLYAADAADGRIYAFDTEGWQWLGALPGFRAPVAALAADRAGNLWALVSGEKAPYRLEAAAACVESGSLTSGLLDAGEGLRWARVLTDAELPSGAELRLELALSDSAAEPAAEDWLVAPALDMFVAPLLDAGGRAAEGRFLRLRAVLRAAGGRHSPRLRQLEASTPGEDLRAYLPAIFRDDDGSSDFLQRLLSMLQAGHALVDRTLADLPGALDPTGAPQPWLPRLAEWLALAPTDIGDAGDLRALVPQAFVLHARRGTLPGLRAAIGRATRLATPPLIVEHYRERRIWQLGVSSALGFDTALAPAAPDGIVVPGLTLADPTYRGLRGDYYAGTDFERLLFQRLAPQIAFGGDDPPFPQGLPADNFSVRWTGQLLPRFSETYTFTTSSDDGVRLWVDGRLLIDNWTDHALSDDRGWIALEGGRWHPIVLEFYQRRGAARIRLTWSSRNQPQELVPQERLYALLDEHALLDLPPGDGTSGEVMLVGQTSVGGSVPLAAGDYGLPLFAETAHRYSLLVPAAALPEPGDREALRRLIEAEGPAHCDFDLCFLEARMRVGVQSTVGVDSIVAGQPGPLALGSSRLGLETVMGGDEQVRVGAMLGSPRRIE